MHVLGVDKVQSCPLGDCSNDKLLHL